MAPDPRTSPPTGSEERSRLPAEGRHVMDAIDVIRAKRDGHTLTDEQVDWVIDAYTRGAVGEEQMAALLMAIVFRGMATSELARWTNAMIDSGERMVLGDLGRPTADKHSTGGVGD